MCCFWSNVNGPKNKNIYDILSRVKEAAGTAAEIHNKSMLEQAKSRTHRRSIVLRTAPPLSFFESKIVTLSLILPNLVHFQVVNRVDCWGGQTVSTFERACIQSQAARCGCYYGYGHGCVIERLSAHAHAHYEAIWKLHREKSRWNERVRVLRFARGICDSQLQPCRKFNVRVFRSKKRLLAVYLEAEEYVQWWFKTVRFEAARIINTSYSMV